MGSRFPGCKSVPRKNSPRAAFFTSIRIGSRSIKAILLYKAYLAMKKILIIEDDKDIQDVFKIIFSSFGYKVDCMADGLAVVEMTGNWPDAIILDKQLPGLNGVDVCKTLKSRHQSHDIPVLMISATSGVEQAAKLAGADDYLEKPFNMHIILKKVNALIEQGSHKIH
jgi:DNA-binding response OmpR family regulator